MWLAINQRTAGMNHMFRRRELSLPNFNRLQYNTIAKIDALLLHNLLYMLAGLEPAVTIQIGQHINWSTGNVA